MIMSRIVPAEDFDLIEQVISEYPEGIGISALEKAGMFDLIVCGYWTQSWVSLQIDIGFGDVIVPGPRKGFPGRAWEPR